MTKITEKISGSTVKLMKKIPTPGRVDECFVQCTHLVINVSHEGNRGSGIIVTTEENIAAAVKSDKRV